MAQLFWIILSGLAMSAIALVGAVTLFLEEATLRKLLLPLVALSAGSLIGGAFFHLIPEGFTAIGDPLRVGLLVVVGFIVFLVLEVGLHWHHCSRAEADCRAPRTYLILIGDGVHKFLGGLAIGGMFMIDVRLGAVSWLAAAMHEVPQELGDFAVLVHGGWKKGSALLMNALSALTFLIGGLIAYSVSFAVDVTWLAPIAGGNFLYVAASDLVPEIREHPSLGANLLHLGAFMTGIALLYVAKILLAT